MTLKKIILKIIRAIETRLRPAIEREPGLIAEIQKARAELWEESSAARRQAAFEAAYPVALELAGAKLRSKSPIKPSCRKCHGRG